LVQKCLTYHVIKQTYENFIAHREAVYLYQKKNTNSSRIQKSFARYHENQMSKTMRMRLQRNGSMDPRKDVTFLQTIRNAQMFGASTQ